MFRTKEIEDAFKISRTIGSKESLGIIRWDAVKDFFAFSGTISLPITIAYHKYEYPLYYILEKFNDQEMLYIKPLKGAPFRLGDIYGFIDMQGFEDYTPDKPIILVEGVSDKVALSQFYKYVLATGTAHVNAKQVFFLKNIAQHIIMAYDSDAAGKRGFSKSYKTLKKHNLEVSRLVCPRKDWGSLNETEYGRCLMEKVIKCNSKLKDLYEFN